MRTALPCPCGAPLSGQEAALGCTVTTVRHSPEKSNQSIHPERPTARHILPADALPAPANTFLRVTFCPRTRYKRPPARVAPSLSGSSQKKGATEKRRKQRVGLFQRLLVDGSRGQPSRGPHVPSPYTFQNHVHVCLVHTTICSALSAASARGCPSHASARMLHIQSFP